MADSKATNYWLMKTEPEVFSFDDLLKASKRTTGWDGVRNYQARNFMRDDFKIGDMVLLYHSNAEPAGIVGTARVVREAYPDELALDKNSEYFDEKSYKDGVSRWVKVDVQAQARFKNFLSLDALRAQKSLANMLVLKRGMRLSVQPVTKAEWDVILKLGQPVSV